MDVDLPGLRSGAVRGHWLGSVVVATRSGFYVPPGGPVPGGDPELAVADWFPEVAGATVVHVHADPVSGGFVAGGRVLTAAQFAAQFGGRVAALPGAGGEGLVVLVACKAAAAAAVLAAAWGRPVLAADSDVCTDAGGTVTAADQVSGADGRPELRPGNWVLAVAGGGTSGPLGADLLDVLGRGGPGPVPVPGVAAGRGRRPGGRGVWWTGPGRGRGGQGAAAGQGDGGRVRGDGDIEAGQEGPGPAPAPSAGEVARLARLGLILTPAGSGEPGGGGGWRLDYGERGVDLNNPQAIVLAAVAGAGSAAPCTLEVPQRPCPHRLELSGELHVSGAGSAERAGLRRQDQRGPVARVLA